MTAMAPRGERVALVTGSSRGIGLAIAQRLVEEGYRVWLTARRAQALADVVATFPQGRAFGVAGSADDASHRDEVFAQIRAESGRLDVLVNNAGINPVYGPLASLDLDAARKILDVNVIGTLAWTQGALSAGLGEHDGACIVNLSSVTADLPAAGIGWYGVSKAAVSHLTRTLAAELAPRVRVNAVAPAVVKTRFAKALYEGREQEVAAGYPMGRLGTPEDIANAVSYLVGSGSEWVTGQVMTLDGGLGSVGGTA